MDGFVKLAATVLAQIAALDRIRTTAPQLALTMAVGLLAVAAAVGGAGCGVAALWIWLLPLVGPWGAPLICGGVLLLGAAMLGFGVHRLLRHTIRPTSANGALAAALEGGDFAPLIQEHKWMLLGLALLAGVTAADKIARPPRAKR
ncbi:MAG TPA: hypothetical protein VNG52_01900 [Stellaceae bacterium]|nr:hypothetical protein [Stellaceae bacterium]